MTRHKVCSMLLLYSDLIVFLLFFLGLVPGAVSITERSRSLESSGAFQEAALILPDVFFPLSFVVPGATITV